jgi:anaerobic magnesium-protoporphyrin IX monomethyl ester cyclase
MNICLISPYSDFTANGVRLLSAILKKHGHSTTVLFLVDMGFEGGSYLSDFSCGYPEKLLPQILEHARQADVIGLSLLTPYFSRSVQLTQYFKEHLSTPIIWGGVHPTLCPEPCLQQVDYICVGEGEQAFPEFVEALGKGGDLYSIPNIWARRNGDIVRNSARPLLEDLDSLPYPDYGPEGHWVVSMDNRTLLPATEELNRKYLYLGPVHERIWTYQILTSRGCPHQCSFCGNLALHQAAGERLGYRARSVEHVIGELEEIHKRYEIRSLLITDDAFMAYKTEEIRKFCELYKEKIGAPFRINATPVLMKEEKVRLLFDAGLRWLEIGIQSGSPQILELFKRQWCTPERVLRSAEMVKPYQKECLIIYDLIVDNPWESIDNLLETLQLILKLPRPYHLQSFPLMYYPGTELYHRAIAEGIIQEGDLSVVEKTMQKKRACYINFLFTLAGVQWIPRWLVKVLAWRPLVKIGNRHIFDRVFDGIYLVARYLKTVFFRHPAPKDLVIDVEVS